MLHRAHLSTGLQQGSLENLSTGKFQPLALVPALALGTVVLRSLLSGCKPRHLHATM